MALLGSQDDYQLRHSKKEPDWSSICNNVFDEYLDDDDLFGFEPDRGERNSSNDSINLFDFSGSSEQSHQTEATSPIPSWEPVAQQTFVEAQQPKAKEPGNFWEKTLKALERNAAESEKRQQNLRSTKSHPDFLSLGGHPTPPVIPSSPTDQSFSAQLQWSRSAANGKRRNITSRSLSRGRPTGVTKTAVAGCVNPYATVRKCSASPPKMMNPSRYRAGFKEIWADKIDDSPKKYKLRVPSFAIPASPPPSGRTAYQEEFASFGSDACYPLGPSHDDFVSPLTNSFQNTHIHTPLASPNANHFPYSRNSHFKPLPPLPPSSCPTQVVPLNDTAPLYPVGNPSLSSNKIQAFDFGFSSPPDRDNWDDSTCRPTATVYSRGSFTGADPFGNTSTTIVPSTEGFDTGATGLGISCDPLLISNYTVARDTPTLPMTTYQPIPTAARPHYSQPHPHGLPSTPHHHRSRSYHRSHSPSPPATEPRSSKRASVPRRSSRHRRTKSTNSTPRHAQSPEKGAFVNFTPDDSTKILGGVAPSGSSKTKARREKEAADKRRRLSQIAVRAVVEAGGDLDALNKAGLFV